MRLNVIHLFFFLLVAAEAFQRANIVSSKVPLSRLAAKKGEEEAPDDAPKSKRKSTYTLFNFKKGEKKEVGRLIKNIMFPGIYQDYDSTASTRKTVQVTPKNPTRNFSRYDAKDLDQSTPKVGTYNVQDESTLPKVVTMSALKKKTIKKVDASDFKVDNKMTGLTKGGKVLPGLGPRPKKPIILWEYENDPASKKVREACTLLDLIVEFRPTPGGTYGWADDLNRVSKGGRDVPYMVDPNPMYRPEAAGNTEIVTYLFEQYGPDGAAPPKNLVGRTGGSRKTKPRQDTRPDFAKLKPINVFGWEGAGPLKQVRNTLSDLNLAHIFINVADGSVHKSKLTKAKGAGGAFAVPFIVDPNTGIELFDAKQICSYLEKTYTI